MAKTVQPIAIELAIKGEKELAALNRSFRDLSKQVKFSDADIIQATKDVAKFAQEAGNSEATIEGQIKAFKGLREQATMGGKAYTELTQEISNLKSTLRGSSDAVERERSNLVKLGSASKNSAKDLQYVIAQLEKLKSKVREDSAAFLQLGKDIKNLNVNLKEVEISAGKARFAINTILSAKPEKITGQIDTLNAAIASGTLEAEDLNAALRKLELLRVSAGRGPVAFRADVFSSQLGVDYFARLRKEYDNLEKTQAAITQRISEVNTELQNVSGYERRRSLTLELIRLNKELQQSIVSVTTGEQFQAMAIRQRMGGARESYAASGFGAFSAEIRQRTEAGEFTPGMQRARERARNEIVNEEAVRATTDIFDTWEQAYGRIVDAARDHKIEMARIKKSEGDLLIEIQDRQAAEELSREKAQNDKLLESFDQRLKQRNRVLQRSIAIKGSLGLSGTELSPLYEGIVGIGTSRASAEQARMGRTPQQALTDIIDVFNSDLDRTGDGFLDSERKLREAAIEFSGGSRKVRQAFEGIALGKTPEGMFPRVGESSREYRERLEISSRNLFDSINIFSRRIKKTGDGFLDSEQKLREAAIDFAGGSLEVKRAFEKIPLGKTPISMFPGSAESKESYLQRLRGGFSEFNLPDFVDFRKGTTRELQLVRQQLEEFRLDLDPLSANFEKLEKQAVTSISKIDKQLARRSRSGGRRLSAGQLAQAAGATISGGIFGGPEGFLGGAIGTAFGRAGGAFAGAAIGAQIGGLRREVGGYAEYAAQIEKLKIALEGISGPQEEYNRALEAANSVTNDLNVPQEVAIRGITRLTAAVKGAGGGVADAELAFKNINSAIIATGGGAEQVEGAVTALVQIFSKGKVSAEEINQIAERLPGTFNKIAEASGRTGPQLTKALQDGEVGLNDLMKFLVELGDEYGLLAQKIADSSESAGARLQVAYDKMRQEVGKALQPIGAEFQDAFTEFLTDITPALIDAAKAVGDGMKFIFDNREAIGTVASLAAKIVAVNFAFKAFAALNGPVKAMFLMLQAEMGKTAVQANVANGKAAALLGTLKTLATIGIITVGIDIFFKGLANFDRVADKLKELKGLSTPEGAAGVFEGLTKEQALEKQSQLRQQLSQAEKNLASYKEPSPLLDLLGPTRKFFTGESKLESASRKNILKKEVEALRAQLAVDISGFKSAEPLKLTEFPGPDSEDEDKKGGRSKEKQQRKSQLESIRNGEKLLDIELMLLENSREIGKAQFENNFARVSELNNQKISLEFAKQAAQNEFEYRDAVAQAIGDENQAAIIQEAALKREIQDKLLLIQYEGALSDEAQRRALEQKAAAKASQDELFSLREKLGLVSDQERISRYRTNLEEQGTPNADELTDLYRQTVNPTFAEGTSQNIRALKKDLEELLDPINQVTGAANAIGTAFTDSFMSAITGSATAQEALANFFSNTAKFFLDMAAQIIQKMITMAILNQVVGLLPGGNVGGGGGGDIFADIAARGGLRMKNGGAFDKGGLVPFAMGGIVDKPTMFAYANGGVGRFGIMGEAGPEAILPLQRGPGGKLGVQASGSSVGDVVVNVDASGTRAQGDNQSASQLGNVIGAAVQAELIKQKRPGGLLA
jgi:tape measure domain-containing protein